MGSSAVPLAAEAAARRSAAAAASASFSPPPSVSFFAFFASPALARPLRKSALAFPGSSASAFEAASIALDQLSAPRAAAAELSRHAFFSALASARRAASAADETSLDSTLSIALSYLASASECLPALNRAFPSSLSRAEAERTYRARSEAAEEAEAEAEAAARSWRLRSSGLALDIISVACLICCFLLGGYSCGGLEERGRKKRQAS